MATVLNPLAYNDIGTPVYYWLPLGTRNRIHYHTSLVEMQKAAIREDPGSFREEKREERNRLSKKPQSGKIREASGKVSGKRREHSKFRFCSVSIRFPSTRFPQSGLCLNFMVKRVHTGSHKCCFWPGRPRDPFFKARNHFGETLVPVPFLQPVSGSVSRRVKKPQSGKIREVSGKVSGKSNNKPNRVGTGIKNNSHIYIYIYIYISATGIRHVRGQSCTQ